MKIDYDSVLIERSLFKSGDIKMLQNSNFIKILALLLLIGCTEENIITAPQPDHTPPSITWHQPMPDAELSGQVELNFSVTDSSGINRISVYRNGLNPADWTFTPEVQDTSFNIAWDTRTVSDGLYILEIRAWDNFDNISVSPSLLVKVHNQPEPPPEDNTPPDVWWLAPEAGSTLTDTVTIQISFFDESGVDSIVLLKDGGLAVSLPPAPRGGTEGGAEYLWDTRQDSDGVHLLEARAWDAVGNTGVSACLLVRVQNHETPPEDHTPPVIVWRSPTPGDTLQGRIELRFDVMDDVGVDSVRLIVNGRSPAAFILLAQQEVSFSFEWNSNNFEDGAYLIEIRAWDASGNIGFGSPISFRIWNDRPRVLWVPDDYETIQGAINASKDGDTVRVRAGTYYEGLRLMGKEIWLESEEGPKVTTIDSRGWNNSIMVMDNEGPNTVVRGFRHFGGYSGMNFWDDVNINVYNCVFDSYESIGANLNFSNSKIYNCIFINCNTGFRAWLSWGSIYNCIFTQCSIGMRNYAETESELEYGWNLFWINENDYYNYEPSQTDKFDNPLFIEGTYILDSNSPAIDAGKPDIIDPDGSISDIGIYGGPYAYSIR
jgi:hypothetical protein